MNKPMNELRFPHTEKINETLELVELGKKARIVFHDLSNHLTALTLSVGQLEENLARDTERLREYAKRSEKARTQMEYVVNLLRSHIENTGDTLFNASAEISKVIQTFSEKTEACKINVHFELSGQIDIFGSKSAFLHIATNLFSNAIEAFDVKFFGNTNQRAQRKETERQIKIILERTHSIISLSVSDTGSGIKKSIINKIFEPKFTTKSRGHGIGLSTIKEYIEEKFKGKISVISEVGKGTTFLVSFPAPKEQENIPTHQNRKRYSFPVPERVV